MNEPGYRRIIEALDNGRRALVRARLTAGAVRFLGIVLATGAGLVLWALLQRALRFYSVPVATAASVIGAGLAVFALVRWLVIPLVRLPGRDDFVAMVERRYPEQKNLIVNAYQLGSREPEGQTARAGDLVEALVARASQRIENLDLRRWRDPAPDRPFLWAGGAALVAMALLAVISPSLLATAMGQIVRPSLAQAPPVAIAVTPGSVEIDRGGDLEIVATVSGAGASPTLRFRERNGTWRNRDFQPRSGAVMTRDGGVWWAQLADVDRNLEYQVAGPRTESPVYTVTVREPPRLAGFRASLRYPTYSGLSAETITSGTGELAALKGTEVDLRVLTNRPLSRGWLEWYAEGAAPRRADLESIDPTTWKAAFTVMEPASYSVVLADETGAERLRSPRYRLDAVPDRAPYLTLHYPQEDHDLADDMMERIVADAADDYGFSSCRLSYRIDDGQERSTSYAPYTTGQKEFRLDTVWDLKGLGMGPGSVLSYYLEVRDNDAVSGAKSVRSPVRRVRFPTVGEIYADVAKDQDREIGDLSDMRQEQTDLRDRLQKLSDELKQGKELNWDLRRDVEKSLERQASLEEQLSEVSQRMQETVNKASDRAQMNQALVQKMAEINDLIQNMANEELKRSFQELSAALDKMDRDAIRRALEKFQTSQEDMLKGLDRTVELLKQIKREGQVEDVVRRTDEIAQLQEQIAKELEKMGARQEKEQDDDAKQGDEAKQGEQDPEAKQKPGDEQQPGDPKNDQQKPQDQEGDQNQDSQGEKSDEEKSAEERDAAKQLQEMKERLEKLRDQLAKENEEAQQNKKSGSEQQQGSQDQQERLQQLAQQQEQAEQMVEELRRQLETLSKIQDQQASAKRMEEMQKSQDLKRMQENMKGAQQGMQSGEMKPSADFAFRARDQAKRLADMAKSMQQQMQQEQEDDTIQRMEKVIRGLIQVSGEQEGVSAGVERDERLLAQRQLNLAEATEAIADSLQEVSKQTLAVGARQQGKLGQAIQKMESATRMYEQGARGNADFQGRESASDLNETIVQLMKSHAQMCSGAGSGDQNKEMKEKLGGLSESQEGLNEATQRMLQQLQGKGRLSRTDGQRLQQMAAQQEMIRQGLEGLQRDYPESEKLLGDMDSIGEQMKEIERQLQQNNVDRPLLERQAQILSRMLDAQRAIRQQEMSPERESRTGTLAERQSPPPIPPELLKRERTLEEDVLRGADDKYPAQFRKLVEEYFRALSRENRTP